MLRRLLPCGPSRIAFLLLAMSGLLATVTMAGASGALTPPADAPDRLAASVAQPMAQGPYLRGAGAERALRAVVMGDSMADGLYSGLYRVMKDDARLTLTKKTKVNTGIVRRDRYDWNEAARTIASSNEYDVAILVLGTNDLQSIREDGKAYHFRQPGWEERFRQRVDDIIAVLKAEDIALYWVGLPITRKDRYQDDYAYVNAFFRREAGRYGVRFVETWDRFADTNGEFAVFGADLAGKEIRLRADDGVHFTSDGYQMYATVVADVLRSDMAAAGCGANGRSCGN